MRRRVVALLCVVMWLASPAAWAEEEAHGEAVVLVHGLWMGTWVMAALGHRLRGCGYVDYYFDWSTHDEAPPAAAARLGEWIEERVQEPVVHLLGHSLGGLVVNHLLASDGFSRPGRVVLMGSPIQGSIQARRLAALPGGREILGASIAAGGLLEGVKPVTSGREVGVVAAIFPFEYSEFLGELDGPSDGVVRVVETFHPGAADTLVVRATHSGMLFSRDVAEEVCAFLREGRFLHGAKAAAGEVAVR